MYMYTYLDEQSESKVETLQKKLKDSEAAVEDLERKNKKLEREVETMEGGPFPLFFTD